MNKIILSIFFLSCLIFLTANDVFACSCSPTLTNENLSIEQQVKNASIESSSIFVGKVLQIKKSSAYSNYVTVRFEVEKNWNERFQKEITVSTGDNGALCGYEFEVGKKYLVYAYGENNKLLTDICTRTASVISNKDVAVLNKIKKPKLKSSPK